MSLEKQLEYLSRMKEYHTMLFKVNEGIFKSLMERVEKVY